jgi:hypothetical protein
MITAGKGALAVQQLALTVTLESDAGAQQLCAPTCFIGRQVSNGASKAAIKTMAMIARR